MGAAAGPHLPSFRGDTEETRFSFEVSPAAFYRMGVLSGLCSSVPLVASADAGFVDLCTPEPGLRAELEKRGKWVP